MQTAAVYSPSQAYQTTSTGLMWESSKFKGFRVCIFRINVRDSFRSDNSSKSMKGDTLNMAPETS